MCSFEYWWLICDIWSANKESFTIVKEALDEFYYFSRLKPNLQKSAMFLSGVNAELQAVLSEVLPIPIGSSPVKYLGVPLISTRLVYSDSLQLKEKKLRVDPMGCYLLVVKLNWPSQFKGVCKSIGVLFSSCAEIPEGDQKYTSIFSLVRGSFEAHRCKGKFGICLFP